MNAFIAYLHSIGPDFISGFRGTSPEKIAELEARVGYSLPRPFGEYLAVMGESHGELPLFWDFLSQIGVLLDLLTPAPSEGNPNFLAFAESPVGGGDPLAMRIAPGADRFPVHQGTIDETMRLSKNFYDFLFQRAFSLLELAPFSWRGDLGGGGDERRLPKVRPIVESLGWLVAPFSDAHSLCARAPWGVVSGAECSLSGIRLEVAAREETDVILLCERVQLELAFTPLG